VYVDPHRTSRLRELQEGDFMAKVFRWHFYGRDKRTDTAWWIRYRDADGKDRRERIGPSKRQAEQVLATRLAAITEGRKLPDKKDGSILLSDFAQEYLRVVASRQAWGRNVATMLRQWQEHLGAQCRLRDITPRKVEAFRESRLSAGIAPGTVNRNLAVLKRLLTVAVEWDLIQDNPVRRVKPLRGERSCLRFLTEEEARRLLEACARSGNEFLESLVVLALNTGARKGELLGLRWKDVSFEAATIAFPQTKNGTRRDIPINAAAIAALRRVRRLGGGDRVFSRSGRDSFDFRSAWEVALKAAGIEDFRFHDLRHTYASWAAHAGMDIRRLQRLLGHKTLAMTQRYSHLGPRDLREAVAMVAIEPSEAGRFRARA
jgi:integrase